jgi:hypothetical protein
MSAAGLVRTSGSQADSDPARTAQPYEAPTGVAESVGALRRTGGKDPTDRGSARAGAFLCSSRSPAFKLHHLGHPVEHLEAFPSFKLTFQLTYRLGCGIEVGLSGFADSD